MNKEQNSVAIGNDAIIKTLGEIITTLQEDGLITNPKSWVYTGLDKAIEALSATAPTAPTAQEGRQEAEEGESI